MHAHKKIMCGAYHYFIDKGDDRSSHMYYAESRLHGKQEDTMLVANLNSVKRDIYFMQNLCTSLATVATNFSVCAYHTLTFCTSLV